MKTEIQRTQADWHARHPHLRWKGSELVGPCMVCGTGDDRFYVRADGGAFCRVCCEDGSNPEAVKRLFAAHGFGGNGSADQFERDTGKAVTQLSTNGTGRPTEPPAPPLCGWQETNADGSVVTFWRIQSTAGETIRVHCRRDPGKHIWWQTADGGRGLAGMAQRDLPLYGTEQAIDRSGVLLVEGEKAADALRRAMSTEGPPTVLSTTGTSVPSSTVMQELVNRIPEHAPIWLWPDQGDVDDKGSLTHAGEKLMQKIGTALSAYVQQGEIRVIDWDDGTPGCDAADWVDAGCSPSISELRQTAVTFKVKTPSSKAKRGRPRKEPTRPDNPGGLPEIAVIPGTATEWKRAAVRALVEAGPRDDLRSLYASPVTATATGETTGGVTLLRTQPQVDVDSAAKWSADADGGGAGGAVRWPAGELVIEGATDKAIKTILESNALWVKPHPRRVSDLVPTDPSDGQAADVIEMYRQDCGHAEHPRLRLLRGIVDAPTLRADGTLLAAPGYDRQSGLYADFHAKGWEIPTEPTQEDARVALAQLHDVVQESQFATPEHRAVWVAGLLTIVGREYARGNVPLFAMSANNRGAGKGTLVDMATAVATGRPAAKWAPTGGRRSDAEAEEDKRLTTVALNGTRVLLIDNVRAGDPIGTPALDRAMTAGADGSMGEVSGRLLGKNIEAKAPWRVVVWATGNNLVTRGDLDRRVLLCRLHTDMERPEERRFNRQSPVDYCIEHRRELLTACLVILLAHRRAADNREAGAVLPPWGSFVYWSARIRSAVAWADPDHADPKRTADEVHEQAHPEQLEAAVFFDAWHAELGTREATTRDVLEAVGYGPKPTALADALAGIEIQTGKDGRASPHSLASWLSAHRDRPGPVILRAGARVTGKPAKWYVELAPEVEPVVIASAPAAPQPVDHPDLLVTLTTPVLNPGDGGELIASGSYTWAELWAAMDRESRALAAAGLRRDVRITTGSTIGGRLTVHIEFIEAHGEPDPSLPLPMTLPLPAPLTTASQTAAVAAELDRRVHLVEDVTDPHPGGGGAVWIEAGEYRMGDLRERLNGCRLPARLLSVDGDRGRVRADFG